MKSESVVEFQGPFSWVEPSVEASIIHSEVSKLPGVYLWTVETPNGFLVYYVGETGVNFRTRMRDHYKEQLSGMYHIYDPELFSLGEKRELWRGIYGKGGKHDLYKFLDILPLLVTSLIRFVSIIRFYVAPINFERRLRKRFEAALANHLYSQPGVVGAFQDKGIRYELRRNSEDPTKINIICPKEVLGIPTALHI
jgi:hypothetical protein